MPGQELANTPEAPRGSARPWAVIGRGRATRRTPAAATRPIPADPGRTSRSPGPRN